VQPASELSVTSQLDEDDLVQKQSHEIEGLGHRTCAWAFFSLGHDGWSDAVLPGIAFMGWAFEVDAVGRAAGSW
jgi:hypothetical protein